MASKSVRLTKIYFKKKPLVIVFVSIFVLMVVILGAEGLMYWQLKRKVGKTQEFAEVSTGGEFSREIPTHYPREIMSGKKSPGNLVEFVDDQGTMRFNIETEDDLKEVVMKISGIVWRPKDEDNKPKIEPKLNELFGRNDLELSLADDGTLIVYY